MATRIPARILKLKQLSKSFITSDQKLQYLEDIYKHKYCARSVPIYSLAYIFDCSEQLIIDALKFLNLYNTKLCKTCNEWLDFNKFYYSDSQNTRIYDAHCINCKNTINTNWHENNREYHNLLNAHNNRVLYKDVINETHIIKIKNDYAYKLKKQLGSAVWAYLKRDSNSKYLSLLPFHISELKPHLEKQFKSDMNWNNYGTCWSLDHIKPISSFNIVDENCDDFRECWSFNNLQPLYVSENAKKYNKYVAGT
jgi:hypothetical protein